MQNKTFSAFPNIRLAMSQAGLSSKEMAHRLGMSPSSLYRRLRGSIDFRWDELRLLHTAFPDVPVSFLLERSSD